MRPRIILVAHDVGGLGGMERALEELVRHASASYDVTVVSSTLTPELRPLVRWRRARVPRRPVPLKLVAFFVVAGARLALRRDRAAVVHTCGAIVPNRADVVSVHTCHAAFVEQTGLLAPHELSRPRPRPTRAGGGPAPPLPGGVRGAAGVARAARAAPAAPSQPRAHGAPGAARRAARLPAVPPRLFRGRVGGGGGRAAPPLPRD